MPRTSSLNLPIHPNLQTAFAELYPTVEAFVAAEDYLAVPEDHDLQFTQQAEEALLDHIKTHLAPQPINGLSLQEDVLHKSRILSTGCDSLDEILLNGLREGQVTEIAGGLATGKTQLCLQITAVTAWRGEKVVYVDTGQAFSARRVMEIASAVSPPVNQQAQDWVTSCLSNIDVHDCHSIQDLISKVAHIDQKIQGNKESVKTSVVIVDSLAALCSGTLGLRNSMQGHCLLVQASILLKRLADKHNLAVVITNFTVAGQSEVIKPAMGESWRHQPHTRIILTRQDKGDQGPEWSAVLASSLLTPTGPRTSFVIDNRGVHKPITDVT